MAVILAATVVTGIVLSSDPSIPDDRLATIEVGDLALSVVATGSVIPVSMVEIKSKATGLVQSIQVEDGDQVKEGQALIELDKELLQAQLREAEAARMAALARVEEAKADTSSAVAMKRKVELDLKNLEDHQRFLQRQVERYQSMFEETLIARFEWEQRESEFQDVVLQAEALRSELLMQQARIEAAEKAVARVEAQVIQAEANLDRAQQNLRNATILSPINGTVLKTHVEVGNAVSSILQLGSQATLLITLGDMSTVLVEGRVNESDIGTVFEGQEARVTVDAFREKTFPGTVARIAPLGEEKDSVIGFEVRVSIQDPDKIFRAQMSANSEIIIEEKRGILLIPENAVIYDRQGRTFAEVYDTSVETFRRRVPLEIGISNGTSTELISGLEKGETVVLQ